MKIFQKWACCLAVTGMLLASARAAIRNVEFDEPEASAPYLISPETEVPPFDDVARMMIHDMFLLYEMGRTEDAREVARKLEKGYPDGPELKWTRVWQAYYEKNFAQAVKLGSDYLNLNPSMPSIILPTMASAALLRDREAMDRVMYLIPQRSRELPVCSWSVAFEQALGGRIVQTSPPTRLRIGAEHIRPFINFLSLHGSAALQQASPPAAAAFYSECIGPVAQENMTEIVQIIKSGAWRAEVPNHDAALLRLESLGVRVQMVERDRADRFKALKQWEKYDALMAQILPLRRLDAALWLSYGGELYEREKYAESLPYLNHALKILPPTHVRVRFLTLSCLLMNQRPEDTWPILSEIIALAPSKLIQWIEGNQNEPEFQSLRSDPRFLKLVRSLNWPAGEALALAPAPETESPGTPGPMMPVTNPNAPRTIKYAAGGLLALGLAGFILWMEYRRKARRRHARHHPSSGKTDRTQNTRETHAEWSPEKERMRQRRRR